MNIATQSRTASRRSILAGLAALAPSAAFAGRATAKAPADPIVGLLEEWRVAKAAYEDAPIDCGDEEDMARFHVVADLETRIFEIKATSLEGVAAQLDIVLHEACVDDLTGGTATRVLEQIIGSLRAGQFSGAFAGV